jgi:prepilin-type N-terminal cleavage/methylation domain-containing protein
MIKQRGFTLIEFFIALTFIAVLGTIVMGAVGAAKGDGSVSMGINGLMETRCVEGYRFVVDQQGNARQILDEFGKGARCENPNAGKPGAFGKM